MKTLIALLLLAICAQADTKHQRKPKFEDFPIVKLAPIVPNSDLRTVDSITPAVAWMLDKLAAMGFAAPVPPDPFRMSDYLSSTEDQVAKKGDVVFFKTDTGAKCMGLAMEDGDKHGVTVAVPVDGRTHAIAVVPYDYLIGYLRPHKAEAKPTPTPEETTI